jgi:hypothetical protein
MKKRERERERNNRDWMMTTAYWVITRRDGHNRGCKTQKCRAHCRFQNRSSFEILCFTHTQNEMKWNEMKQIKNKALRSLACKESSSFPEWREQRESRTKTADELDFNGEKSSIPFLARARARSPSPLFCLRRWRWAKQRKPSVIVALFVDDLMS